MNTPEMIHDVVKKIMSEYLAGFDQQPTDAKQIAHLKRLERTAEAMGGILLSVWDYKSTVTKDEGWVLTPGK